MTISSATAFAADWVAAFNAHDLSRVLSHYADDIELVSPIYLDFTGGATDMLSGKEALRGYFGAALDRYPDLRFTLLEIAEGTRGLCLHYHSNIGDRIAMECIERDSAGRARRAICHYVDHRAQGGEDHGS